jgi:CBS domain-containing protein
MKTVKDILASKGREVWSVAPNDTVFAAVQVMADKEIGALLVMRDEVLCGIVTERDYARKVILEGRTSRDTLVSDVMTTDVLSAAPEHTVEECMALMTNKRARHLPVIDDKQVVGLVSIGDLVKAMIEDQKTTIDQLQHYIAG